MIKLVIKHVATKFMHNFIWLSFTQTVHIFINEFLPKLFYLVYPYSRKHLQLKLNEHTELQETDFLNNLQLN